MTDVNARFTDLADRVSEGMGSPWASVIALLLVLGWLASGPFFGWSDTWQLLVNTPTTIAELFIGFLLAAAANRAERRNRELLEAIRQLVERENDELQVIEEGLARG